MSRDCQRTLGWFIWTFLLIAIVTTTTTAVNGSPLKTISVVTTFDNELDSQPPHTNNNTLEPSLFLFISKLIAVVVLVLLGAVFAGLTLGLMGLDLTNLHVIKESGTPEEQANAAKVLRLLDKGKHLVLITLLLSNVIVNETLPIILDSVLGGGLQAVIISTALIVIFGEVIPQCAKCSTVVLILMYIMYPLGYPMALLLDHFLGKNHGTVYKKAGLKTLVSLHRSEDTDDGLTADEVLIIRSVLDLRDKPVSKVMTPIEDVYTLSMDSILDKETVEKILFHGYSRIPIRATDDKKNFVGILLVKQLITYDVDDALPVRYFNLSPLPETAPNTSCLDILNFFQEGRSHLALISSNPGGLGGALGVITLEDVIEELIGEEIIDETDVYVDVHKKVKVMRRQPKQIVSDLHSLLKIVRSNNTMQTNHLPREKLVIVSSNEDLSPPPSYDTDHLNYSTTGYGAINHSINMNFDKK
ncbi:unnamed protein product [Cunninghamella echinulata]